MSFLKFLAKPADATALFLPAKIPKAKESIAITTRIKPCLNKSPIGIFDLIPFTKFARIKGIIHSIITSKTI